MQSCVKEGEVHGTSGRIHVHRTTDGILLTVRIYCFYSDTMACCQYNNQMITVIKSPAFCRFVLPGQQILRNFRELHGKVKTKIKGTIVQ